MRQFLVTATGLAICVVVGLALMRSHAEAAGRTKEKGVAIGEQAPTWKDLEGVDGKQHSLSDLKKKKAVLVVFTCNHCPVAQMYEDRLNEIQAKYADEDVAVVAINVNNMEADKLPAMKKRAEEKGFEFAYLYDPSQEIGRAFGASVTPHAFVLDGDRKVVYMGAIDDNMSAGSVEAHYVRSAIEAVLAGEEVEPAKTKPAGCGIRYE